MNRADAIQKLCGQRRAGPAMASAATLLVAWLGAGPASADTANYPKAAPIAEYRIASQADEVALARSAAPSSISNDAEIMTLGATRYETAVKGKNGFVCLVERSWGNEPDQPEFWNPKVRGPICFNPAAVRSVMPTYLERSKWVLAGASREDIARRTRAAVAAGRIRPPEIGAMSYMMSKDGYLGDTAQHWHPHLMLFLPRGANGAAPDWGADLPASPVLSSGPGLDPAAIYFIPLARWSDGSIATKGM